MAIIKHIICAEKVIQEAETGNISVISILDNLGAITLPLFIQSFAILILIERGSGGEPNTGDVSIKITNNSKVIFEPKVLYDFLELNKANVVVSLNGLVIPEPGDVVVTATIADSTATFQFFVSLVPQAIAK